MTAVDWSRYRQCPVCFAETGQPCRSLSGTVQVGGGTLSAFSKVTSKPHSVRKPRSQAVA